MAENDAAHIHKIEEDALSYAARDQKTGQICGLVIGVVTMLAVMLTLYMGHPVAASVFGGTTVVGLVTVFVTGRKSHRAPLLLNNPPYTFLSISLLVPRLLESIYDGSQAIFAYS